MPPTPPNTADLVEEIRQLRARAAELDALKAEYRRASEEQQAQLRRVQRQQTAIIDLVTQEIAPGGFENAAQRITQIAARTLDVQRVGIWLLSEDGRRLRCVDLFDRGSDSHSAGIILETSRCPRYLEALRSGRAIDASDARRDPRTCEFAEDYFTPMGISSSLDAPIRLGGEVIGTLCCEHAGSRPGWYPDEIRFAAEVADQIAHVLAHCRRMEAEEQRLRLEDRIRNAQKLESLGVLAGGIAHDFSNLLVGILGNASLAAGKLPPDSPAAGVIRQIEKAASRAADLTRQMLAYSGKGKFVVEPVDLSRLVQEMAFLLRASISKKAVLEYDFASELPLIEADATQIRQVVMNLITNASEAFGEKGGRIRIATGVMHADRAYLASVLPSGEQTEGRYVYVEVADSGQGMTPETAERVFDPFFTTKFSGRGLGLAVVMGIVRGHNGAIKMETEPGRGTTFRVLFPVPGHQVELVSVERANALNNPTTSATVLVIDDEEIVRSLARRALEDAGFAVLETADGREGLDQFAREKDRIDVVLLDLTMPYLSGEEVFREMKAMDPGVRVVLSSGYSELDATGRFAGAGLAGFLQKPYRVETLIQKLREAMK